MRKKYFLSFGILFGKSLSKSHIYIVASKRQFSDTVRINHEKLKWWCRPNKIGIFCLCHIAQSYSEQQRSFMMWSHTARLETLAILGRTCPISPLSSSQSICFCLCFCLPSIPLKKPSHNHSCCLSLPCPLLKNILRCAFYKQLELSWLMLSKFWETLA